MAQVPAEKNHFSFQTGLITDASPLGHPEDSVQDIENYEILQDGSIRRRRGLDRESGGSNKTLDNTLGTSGLVQHQIWRNSAGTGFDRVIIRSGTDLYFFTDGTTVTQSVATYALDLLAHKVSGKADSDVENNPISVAIGRNKAFVAGKYINPFYIDLYSGSFIGYAINVQVRDFEGIDDGLSDKATPDVLSDEHKYNLQNRGWKTTNINQYNTDKSVYPAKNMWPWKGYRRTVVTNIAEVDGTWAFNSDKMESELFGDASAPQGHLVVTPWNTTTSGQAAGIDVIESVSTDWGSAGNSVTITATSHGLIFGNEIHISGNKFIYTVSSYPITYEGSFDGTYTISNVTTNTFDITFAAPYDYASGPTLVTPGSFVLTTDGDIVEHPDPFTTDERPQVIAWYAGRVWYMGIDDPKLTDRVYFSQIIENDNQYGKCYQEGDPTDPYINELIATDGGVLTIPELGTPKKAMIFNDALLVFSDRGVWEISGSDRIFQADGYRIRQVSDLSCDSPFTVVRGDDTIFWTGYNGIHRIFQDPRTGFLTTETISEGRIRTLWNTIPATRQQKVKAAYDKTKKRVYFLYQSTTGLGASQYDACLVYDTVLQAFYRLKFPTSSAAFIADIFSITDSTDGEDNKNIKFTQILTTRTVMNFCDMDQSDYVDFDGNEQVPYVVTGTDNLQDFHRRKQAPVVHVFSKKTETGYTDVSGDLVPVNPSSTKMTAIWDWSDDNLNSASKVVGHWDNQWQVYRHRRLYTPTGTSDTFNDGFPVVVTRNKVRGSGRALQIRFDGEETYDSHILGWAVHYKATRKV